VKAEGEKELRRGNKGLDLERGGRTRRKSGGGDSGKPENSLFVVRFNQGRGEPDPSGTDSRRQSRKIRKTVGFFPEFSANAG